MDTCPETYDNSAVTFDFFTMTYDFLPVKFDTFTRTLDFSPTGSDISMVMLNASAACLP